MRVLPGRHEWPARDRGLTWKTLGALVLCALAGTAALVAYQTPLLRPVAVQAGLPVWVLLATSAAQTVVLATAAAAAGLWLGPPVDLGAPLLRAWLAGDPDAVPRLRALLPGALLTGALVGLAILGLDLAIFVPALPEALRTTGSARPAWWQGLLAALYGGTVEELLLRLGLMTLLVRAAAALTGNRPPAVGVYWAANAAASLAFGLLHLPATAALVPLSPLIVGRALALNGGAGLVFGWLYWRRGLEAAMAAHLAADIVLHAVAGPLLG